MFDPSPEEPDDPEPAEPIAEKYQEPAIEDIEPTTEELEDFEDVDVPEGLARMFWGLVATINVGLFAAAIGLLLVVFEGDWRRGGAAFVLGVVTLVYAYYKYQHFDPTDRQG